MKRCSKCKLYKKEKEFNKHSRKKDGLQTFCKECNKSYMKEWSSNNLDKRLILQNKRRAKKLKAEPSWLTSLQRDQIKYIYNRCSYYRKLGLDMQVDHIIPLQSNTVCGLHVPWNLQLMLGVANARKFNKY